MDNNLLFAFLCGLVFALAGGSILFSKKALDWMYKEGIWKVAPPFTEKQDRRLNRVTGAGIFLVGIALIAISIFFTFF